MFHLVKSLVMNFRFLKITFCALGLMALCNSCSLVEKIKVGKIESFKLEKVSNQSVTVDLYLPIANPNIFSYKVNNIHIDLEVNGEYIGCINHVQDIVIGAKTNQVQELTFDLSMPSLLQGAFRIMKTLSARTIKVKMNGYVKVKSFLFARKITVNSENTIKNNLGSDMIKSLL